MKHCDHWMIDLHMSRLDNWSADLKLTLFHLCHKIVRFTQSIYKKVYDIFDTLVRNTFFLLIRSRKRLKLISPMGLIYLFLWTIL